MERRYVPSLAEVKDWQDYMAANNCGPAQCGKVYGVPTAVVYYHAVDKPRRPDRYTQRKKAEATRQVDKGGHCKPAKQVFTDKQLHFMLCDALGVDPWR